jgi:hypothetical protein
MVSDFTVGNFLSLGKSKLFKAKSFALQVIFSGKTVSSMIKAIFALIRLK